MKTYYTKIMVIKEDEGGYSGLIYNLPGCCTQGETIDELISNAKEAFSGVLSYYIEENEIIPWEEIEKPEHCMIHDWIDIEVKL